MIFDLLDINSTENLIVLYWSFEMPGHQQIMRAGAKDVQKQISELLSVDKKLADEFEKDYKKK